MPQCVAWGCHYRTDGKGPKGKQTRKTMHRFPKDPERRSVWSRALRREGFQATDTMVLCSDHFEKSCFDRTGQTTRLRKTAVPTLFDFPQHLHLKKGETRKPPAVRTLPQDDPSPSASSNDPTAAGTTPQTDTAAGTTPQTDTAAGTTPQTDTAGVNDHQYMLDTPRKIKRKLDSALETIDGFRKKLKLAKQRSRRLEKKVKTLKSVVDKLKETNLISDRLPPRNAEEEDIIHLR